MAKFQIIADQAGQYRWHLRADNNEIVAISEGYVYKQSAIKSVELVQRLAARAFIEDLTIANKRYF